ncbi:hypothetical protein GCM10009837_07120 [Streptomyces durmitorensis]|uniref:Uncharacterized protein n=1 Tax=Streptomyces durmitorensis TaxID=319947 RepID=A0ABY4PMY8_9ACTN|nr:hypothetical protein [Streptomyces durmitorensis]UQT54393.1 hypothetical protein M4V62_04425 [Streptomyces durmitorensis]
MKVTASAVLEQPPTPTTDHLLDTPLPDLLAELQVELVESRLTMRGFTGYVAREGALTVLALPPDRPEQERDMIVRQLLGTAFQVPMPDPPGEYRITELGPELLAA